MHGRSEAVPCLVEDFRILPQDPVLTMSRLISVSTVSSVYSRFQLPSAVNLLGSTRPSRWSTQAMLILERNHSVGGRSG